MRVRQASPKACCAVSCWAAVRHQAGGQMHVPRRAPATSISTMPRCMRPPTDTTTAWLSCNIFSASHLGPRSKGDLQRGGGDAWRRCKGAEPQQNAAQGTRHRAGSKAGQQREGGSGRRTGACRRQAAPTPQLPASMPPTIPPGPPASPPARQTPAAAGRPPRPRPAAAPGARCGRQSRVCSSRTPALSACTLTASSRTPRCSSRRKGSSGRGEAAERQAERGRAYGEDVRAEGAGGPLLAPCARTKRAAPAGHSGSNSAAPALPTNEHKRERQLPAAATTPAALDHPFARPPLYTLPKEPRPRLAALILRPATVSTSASRGCSLPYSLIASKIRPGSHSSCKASR